MSTQNNAQPIAQIGDRQELAEVIELPSIDMELPSADIESFYQRNSGSLPKSNAGITEAHRRSDLPRPENTDHDPIGDKLRRLFRR